MPAVKGLAQLAPTHLAPLCAQLADGTTVDTVHVEARIQAAGPSQGVLSQLWMLPPDAKYGSDWPASGEVRKRAGG